MDNLKDELGTDIESLIILKEQLEEERLQLDKERKELEAAKTKFFREKVKLRNDMDTLNRQTLIERKRLKEENLFFEKKMDILRDGFSRLEEERRKFDAEKKFFHAEKKTYERNAAFAEESVAEAMFKNITNGLSLRKRYKDLVKIFHPDNLTGNGDLMQEINKEYEKRREELGK